MEIIADLHIHSKYSRACSKELTIPNIAKACETKGIDIVGTGDFTHPAWFSEIKKELKSAGEGIYILKDDSSKTRFILTTELSCIYKKNDKCRRVHLCVLAPSIETVEKIIKELEKRNFNLKSDGRPILGIDAKDLLKLLLDIDKKIMMIPAHIWTPWFAVFGSQSGYDSLQECFEELTPEIFAVETGLSSDPPMNWRMKELDNVVLVSNSDAHSLEKLGREANVFEFDKIEDFSYGELRRILKEKDKSKFLYTIEFFPEEGKYHQDGHRACGVNLHPKESMKNKGICPVCKKPLTLGVLYRVEQLADRENMPKDKIPYKNLIPLAEIISEAVGVGPKSKAVRAEYDKLMKIGSEFYILLHATENEIKKATDSRVAEAVMKMRKGDLEIIPGYDGEFGKIRIFKRGEKGAKGAQRELL
ncbi:MAG: endonuclease Q family protein [Patescibacteria group bacterium]|nr:endonuclease Q family protein [Patescibacteria group bacterium]